MSLDAGGHGRARTAWKMAHAIYEQVFPAILRPIG
jgi:hypothetical protein